MTKLSRFILVIVTIVVTSIALPELYWMAFDKPIKVPYVQYSCIIDDFTIFNSAEGTRRDDSGNSYTRSEYEALLPLMYSRQLMIDERLPDTIRGVETDMHEFMMARCFTRIRPVDFQAPLPTLFPLFESESGRASLEFPLDFFRIDWRMEFINAQTNTIDEEKSRMFSAALYQKGFQFPAKSISGIPTTRKSCDEGYLVIDADEQLYHVKLIKGQPFIKRVDLPKGLKFKHISCVDFKDKLYYAFLISEDNSLYILTQDDYELIRWPIDDYIAEEHQLRINGDYFNYNVTVTSDEKQKSYAMNKTFKVVDTYEYKWLPKEERSVGKVSASLFPFELAINDANSRYIMLYPTWPKGLLWIIVNLLFLGVQLYLVRRRKARIGTQVVDLIIVAFTGVFGFIAVNSFPNKLK